MKIDVCLGNFSSKYCFSDPFRCDCYSGKYFSIYLQKSVEKSDVVRILHGRKVSESTTFSTKTHFSIKSDETPPERSSLETLKSVQLTRSALTAPSNSIKFHRNHYLSDIAGRKIV